MSRLETRWSLLGECMAFIFDQFLVSCFGKRWSHYYFLIFWVVLGPPPGSTMSTSIRPGTAQKMDLSPW